MGALSPERHRKTERVDLGPLVVLVLFGYSNRECHPSAILAAPQTTLRLEIHCISGSMPTHYSSCLRIKECMWTNRPDS